MISRKSLVLVKLALLLAFLAAAAWFLRGTETGRALTPRAALEHIRTYDPLTARLLYVVFYVVGTVFLLPGTVLGFAGAVLFGAYEGTLWTWLGAIIGAALAFGVARLLGRGLVDQLLRGRFEAFDRRLREHGFTGLLIVRLVPLFPFNGVNFASGLTGIRFRDYLAATAIGILPGTFVYQYLFAKFSDRLLEEGFCLGDLWDPELGLALGLFAAFVVVGKWLAGKLQKGK